MILRYFRDKMLCNKTPLKLFLKVATTLVDLLFIELSYISHVQSNVGQLMHITRVLLLCIEAVQNTALTFPVAVHLERVYCPLA